MREFISSRVLILADFLKDGWYCIQTVLSFERQKTSLRCFISGDGSIGVRQNVYEWVTYVSGHYFNDCDLSRSQVEFFI